MQQFNFLYYSDRFFDHVNTKFHAGHVPVTRCWRVISLRFTPGESCNTEKLPVLEYRLDLTSGIAPLHNQYTVIIIAFTLVFVTHFTFILFIPGRL